MSFTAVATPEVKVEYRDKPPYTYTQDGKPQGFLMDRTQAIFRLAGVQAIYDEIPVKRIFNNIKNNRDPICSPSWYKLAERKSYAKFTLIIHRDKPHVLLVAPRVMAQTREHQSLNSFLKEPQLRLGVVAHVSYGPQLDKIISDVDPAMMQAAASPLQLAKMVAFGHGADYMFIDREDYAYINKDGEITALGLQPLDFPDLPPGLNRYLMCSKRVDDQIMEKLNRAIRELLPYLNP